MQPTDHSEIPLGKSASGFPKMTFAAQQVFNEVVSLSAKVPTWTTNARNPINLFVPELEQPNKVVTEEMVQAQTMREDRLTKLSTIAAKERTL